MNFDGEDVRSAWTLESEQAIYGFELIVKATFHDLNRGQPAPQGAVEHAILIAGDDSAKTGFSLCKRCGMVQPSGTNSGDEERKQEHTPDCPDRHATGTGHLLDRLFLYRRFESECLRIMVPRGFGSGERTTYSFMSALQLGLRKRFGGKVDHLRFETMSEAGSEDGSGKTYILIYDSEVVKNSSAASRSEQSAIDHAGLARRKRPSVLGARRDRIRRELRRAKRSLVFQSVRLPS
jgi:DEAD/DEAH box helicase domain-containing protein